MDGYIDRQADGQIDKCMDRQIDGWMDRQIDMEDGWIDGWMDGWMVLRVCLCARDRAIVAVFV